MRSGNIWKADVKVDLNFLRQGAQSRLLELLRQPIRIRTDDGDTIGSVRLDLEKAARRLRM